jgi:hypothetical protein
LAGNLGVDLGSVGARYLVGKPEKGEHGKICCLSQLSSLIMPTLPAWSIARSRIAFADRLAFAFLFSWPSLQSADPFLPIVDHLGALGSHTACMAPILFGAYIGAVTAHRYRIFSQPTSSKIASEVYLADKVRKAICRALYHILSYLSDNEVATWGARATVWQKVNEWGGYLETESVWSNLIATEKQRAETVLMSCDSCRSPALVVLEQLELLDHHAADLDTDVIGWCLAVSGPSRKNLNLSTGALAAA